MNKLILATAIFSLSMLANAQSVGVSVSVDTAKTDTDTATTEDVNIEADKKVANSNCITNTGSRLKSKDKKGCNGEPGRSYDKEDLDRTGAITVGEALERLDPSIQIRR